MIPLVFAAILAAIFVTLIDRLERWRLPRWLGAAGCSKLTRPSQAEPVSAGGE